MEMSQQSGVSKAGRSESSFFAHEPRFSPKMGVELVACPR
jgi:hypothetical protein